MGPASDRLITGTTAEAIREARAEIKELRGLVLKLSESIAGLAVLIERGNPPQALPGASTATAAEIYRPWRDRR